jgi:hypothetical protein
VKTSSTWHICRSGEKLIACASLTPPVNSGCGLAYLVPMHGEKERRGKCNHSRKRVQALYQEPQARARRLSWLKNKSFEVVFKQHEAPVLHT